MLGSPGVFLSQSGPQYKGLGGKSLPPSRGTGAFMNAYISIWVIGRVCE